MGTMDWTEFLVLGDLGQQLDIQKHESRISRLAASTRERDHEQDARIAALEREVLGLEAGVAALVALLRAKGIATAEEIGRALDEATRRAEQNQSAKAEARQEAGRAAAKDRAVKKLEQIRRRRGR
jgi:hypothetical protein